ncbi:uncharacterized protein PAC_16691 [Phialocephala subalpina]|uniref:Uncharacterized protein n=1 Tax=Phialocephala subalpina TaxID=576137 RepID=A0A1L7XP13_9HELO|nr:uncharacterized protein PAC_16691 [Phialocephala subalpina]
MLQWGEIIFGLLLGLLILPALHYLQQPDPQPPARMPSPDRDPTPPPSPILNTISTPYDENEIVDLITELYELLVKLACFPPDEVTWPPEPGHQINEVLCEELHLDPAVTSLMKKLPYLDSDLRGQVHLFPGSEPYSFLKDGDILESRDPENLPPRPGKESKLRLDYLLPHDVALAHNLRYGMTLVLDTKDNTVRMLDSADSPDYVNPEGTVLERPDDPNHYRNYYTQHAPSYIRRLIEKIQKLELIPAGTQGLGREYHGNEDAEVRDEVKKILIEAYGWPDDFRQEDWARDMEEVWDTAIRRATD